MGGFLVIDQQMLLVFVEGIDNGAYSFALLYGHDALALGFFFLGYHWNFLI